MAAITATGSLTVGGVLTIGAPTGGNVAVGMSFTNAAITEPTTPAPTITSPGTGTGGAGTYNTNLDQLITSSTFTFIAWNFVADPLESSPALPKYAIGGTPSAPLPISGITFAPPQPLPETLIGSTTQTSSST